MRLRGISTIEQHVEKIFLLVIALALMGVLAMQFVGEGNTVKVGNEGGVPIDSAPKRVAGEASKQLARIREQSVDERAQGALPNATDEFVKAVQAPLAGADRLAMPLGAPRAPTSGHDPTPPEGKMRLAMPPLPRPAPALGAVYAGALDPVIVGAAPELHELAPSIAAEQPYDARVVTVETEFDAASLVAALRARPQGDLQPFPDPWWQNVLEIVDVELWRQELVDGEPVSEPTLVPPPPLRASLRSDLLKAETPESLLVLAAKARESAQDIIRPPFYAMVAGERWMPPAMSAALEARSGEIDRLIRRAAELKREIESREAELNKPAAPAAGDRRSSTHADRSGAGFTAGVRGGPGRGPGNQSRPPSASPRDSREEIERQRLEKIKEDITRLRAERETVIQELAGKGVDELGAPIIENAADPALGAPLGRLRDAQKVRIWAHDFTVRPGAVYRYQVRLALPNPLFGKEQHLAEEHSAAAEAPILFTPPSEWSAPVAVDQDAYLFVTSASRGGLGGDQPAATALVFRFYYGYWRQATVALRPGDQVAGALDLAALNLRTFEIADGAQGPEVAGESPLSGVMPFAVEGWYLLDVATAPAPHEGKRAEFQAVLRSPEGDLEVRDPSEDRTQERLARLERSAQIGLAAELRTPGSDPAAVAAGEGGGQVGPGPGQTNERDGRPAARPPSSGGPSRLGGG